MREIKFRAWDGSNLIEKMRVGKMELFDDMLAFRFQHFDCDPKQVVFEQFTGLKDKNGREIYEGDLLRATGAHLENPKTAIVSWCAEDTAFEAVPVGYSGEPWRLGALNPRFWKIVGNIHENPELLK